jgi:hypothetical protein
MGPPEGRHLPAVRPVPDLAVAAPDHAGDQAASRSGARRGVTVKYSLETRFCRCATARSTTCGPVWACERRGPDLDFCGVTVPAGLRQGEVRRALAGIPWTAVRDPPALSWAARRSRTRDGQITVFTSAE